MFGFTRPVIRELCLTGLWLGACVSGEILIAKQFGHLTDAVQGFKSVDAAHDLGFWPWLFSDNPDVASLRHAAAIFSILIFAYCIFRYLREVSNNKTSMRMVYYIREAVYDKLQRVGFAFHDALSTGQLINRALTDLQNVRQFLMVAVLTSLEIVLTVVGNIAMLAYKSPLVALMASLPLPLWVWYILRFSRRVQPVAKAVMEAQDRNVSILSENIQGVHVVKAFATEGLEIKKYNDNSDEFFSRVIRRIRLFADFTPVIRAIATLSQLALTLTTAVLILHGKMNVGDFLFISVAMGMILSRLQQVDMLNQQYQAAIVSSRRLYEVLTAKPTVPELPDAPALPPGPGTVRFDHVTFGYDPAKPVLKDVTFEIPGGSRVAIVGPTGAGKTTLVNLLARFYDPQQGTVSIDGMDLRNASLDSIRTQVALVFQETYLFSDTIEANIAYGRPHIRGGEIESAARLAQAHDFIESMPKGYQTILAERGSSLSGGQRQRLAIARAILFNPRVLALDDATASVDSETEAAIRKAVAFVMKEKTTFVIAHRISTVKTADIVLVLENGRLAQVGTHDELMRQGGHYRHIAEAQLYGDDEPPRGADHPSAIKRAEHAQAKERPAPTDSPKPVTTEGVQ
jgi:ATP-binding cassette subfamily B protein